jgi:hypothetical protein
VNYGEELAEGLRKFLLSLGEHPLVFRNWVIAERCDLPEGAIPLTPPPYFRIRESKFDPWVKPLKRGLALGAILPKGEERYDFFYSFSGFPKDGEVLPGVFLKEGWLTWKKRVPPFDIQVFLLPDGTYFYQGVFRDLVAHKIWHGPLSEKTLKKEMRKLLREERLLRRYKELLRMDFLSNFPHENWKSSRYLVREDPVMALTVLYRLELLRKVRKMEDHLLVSALLERREE